eukprot:6204747-Pleurochrysis_carterae.AAC.1
MASALGARRAAAEKGSRCPSKLLCCRPCFYFRTHGVRRPPSQLLVTRSSNRISSMIVWHRLKASHQLRWVTWRA